MASASVALTVEFTLRVVLYPAPDIEGQWIAHGLETDVVTQGDSPEHALAMMAETATAASGLVTVGGDLVPLVGVRVEAEIRDDGVRVVVIQRYRNDERQPIEAVDKFPLEEGAAVCGFEATIDGRRVVGHVEEKEKAFAEYDDAMASGRRAAGRS